MKLFRKLNFFLLIFLLIFLCSCQNDTAFKVPDVTGKFDFTVLKAGQADAIILRTENHSVIIDCGEKDDGDEIAEYLQKNNIKNIDYFFITHFDKDHVGGFPKVMENITASNIIVPDYEGSNDEYYKYLKTVDENNLTVTTLTKNISFTLDDVLFEVSVPKKKAYNESDNDFSLVISVTHGENTFLFAGDAESERITEILSEFKKQYDFLKVPHHGKYNKNTRQLISTIKPRYAVITDSEKNPASNEVISLLETEKVKIYSTKEGNVSVISDGNEISITQ